MNFCAINMAIGKMMQQIVERKNAQFFFQQIGSLRPNAFQVLNGMRQYVFSYGDLKKFTAKIMDEA